MYCLNLFKNAENIKIFHKNFFEISDNFQLSDCYFINDPIKNLIEHNNSFQNLINFYKKLNKQVYFVLVNVGSEKVKIFDQCNLIDNYKIGDRGYYIYSLK